MDILKHTSSKIEKLESAIDAYKIKLEEMYDLKNQMKDMERDNTRYIEQIIQLEEVSEQDKILAWIHSKLPQNRLFIVQGSKKDFHPQISNRNVQETDPRVAREGARGRNENEKAPFKIILHK